MCIRDSYKRYQLLSLHGQTKDALHKNQLGAWEYDIVEPAYKCNMTDIMAGMGLAQIKRYPQLVARRHEIIKIYEDALKGHQVKTLNHEDEKTNSKSSGHLFITRVEGIDEKTRNEIIIKMAERGIATNVHYKPLPMLTAYKNLGFDIKNYPNAFDYYKCEITLPLYLLSMDFKYFTPPSTFCSGSIGFVTPSPFAVAGINCIKPIAPTFDFALGLNPDSVSYTHLTLPTKLEV